MNILYMIGNGFDIHMGLATSYQDFLQYYLKQPLPDIDEVGKRYIKRLKQAINKDIKCWSNLEYQFGQHLSRLGKVGSAVHPILEELDIINDDLRENLSKYIEVQDKNATFPPDARGKLIQDLIRPEQYLRDFEMTEIQNLKESVGRQRGNTVKIMTYNYTNTIERLLVKCPVSFDTYEIGEPIHVHGYYNNRMILGVNDESQINNDILKSDPDALMTLVKSRNNATYGVSHTRKCEEWIKNSNLICCYGLSFGETDKIWWEMIGAELKRRTNLKIILFHYDSQQINYSNNGAKYQRKVNQVKRDFIKKCNVADESEIERIESSIYVVVNSNIFNTHIVETESVA